MEVFVKLQLKVDINRLKNYMVLLLKSEITEGNHLKPFFKISKKSVVFMEIL